MAWTSGTAAYSEKKNLRAASQKDTIGEVYTKTFTYKFGASSNTDSVELANCKIPAGTSILACYQALSASGPANSSVNMKFTTGGQIFVPTAANNTVQTANAAVPLALATNGNATSTVDDTITITQAGSANAVGDVTATVTLVCAGFGGTTAGLTTYTS